MLMSLIHNYWSTFCDLGVDERYNSDLSSSIRITNKASLIVFIVALGYFIYGIILLPEKANGNTEQFYLFHIAAILAILPVILLNKFKWHQTASIALIGIISISLYINSMSLKQPFRTDPYFFAVATYSFLVFRNWKIIVTLFLMQAVAYYMIATNIISNNPEYLDVSNGLVFRVALYFSMLFLLLSFLKLETKKYRRLLRRRSEQLSKEKEAMEKLNFTKDKIFSIISHDLRSPIGSLKVVLSLLKDDNITIEEFKKATSGLENQVDLLHKSLGDMLVWSKAQLTGINSNPMKLKVRDVVQEVMELSKFGARSKKIIMTQKVSHDTVVYCDKGMFRSVISNLLTNAIKFTHNGGAVSVYEQHDEKEVQVIVEDTGIGMSNENIENMLNSTTHFTTSGTNNEKGTGLGVIMCKEFIEKNKGSLIVESNEGKGSRFIVTLPMSASLE